jgi:GGDEF domain-containing protein
MNESADGYTLLARWRGLERQLRRLRREWKSFRDTPTPETLSEILRQTRRFSQALEDLERDVAPHRVTRPVVEHGTLRDPEHGRPDPRDVISASRDLDARMWEAARRWKRVLDGEAAEDLDRLISVLRVSADRSATLVVALGGVLHPPSARRSPSQTKEAPPEVHISGLASEFEGVLWRLQADWQQARRAPNPHRLHLLRESFQVAADIGALLREARERVGDNRFRRALRIGRQLTDGVHFLPYRDPFTGVYNREGFDALAGAELKRCRRYGRPFGLLFIEISPPHLEGLRQAVASARVELREYDLIARYVDDLIVIGVPEGGPGPTRRVASRVLRSLRSADIGGWFRQLSYATLPEDGSTLGGLINSARSRLQA